MIIKASKSEDNGIALLKDTDLKVYSVGISTGGVAEVRMAEQDAQRHIIATTIDTKGAAFAKEQIAEQGFSKQIEVKLEDVAQPLSYQDDYFDFIYARLVLHYLSRQDLQRALQELKRVLKSNGRIFIIVRSNKCADADTSKPGIEYDDETGLTIKTDTDEKTGRKHSFSRFYHSEETIAQYVQEAGFAIEHVASYDEHLYVDFMRTQLAPHKDNVVELLAEK